MIGKILSLPFVLANRVIGLILGIIKLIFGLIFGVLKFIFSHVLGTIIGATVGLLFGKRHVGLNLFPGKKKKLKVKPIKR